MNTVFGIIGVLLSVLSCYVVLRILRVWQGVLRDGLWLFLYGFIFLGFGFGWDLFAISDFIPLTDQFVFALGMALLAGGAFKLFSFVYPS